MKTHDANRDHPLCIVWFIGLSGAGKTTIARLVEADLIRQGRRVFVLDGDSLRRGLCRDLGFSAADRSENLRRAAEVAAVIAAEEFTVLAAFITPLQTDRDRIRTRLSSLNFVEAFVDTPIEVVEQRDTKGLYRRSRLGEISNLTGIDSPFDPPLRPDLHLRTIGYTPSELAQRVLQTISLQHR